VRVARGALLAACLWSLPAFAGGEAPDAEARTAARALAAQGAQAFEQRDFAQALSLFDRASAIVEAPTIELMRARALVELGRLVEALDAYARTEQTLASDASNEAFRQAAADADLEQRALLQRIPTLRVRVLGVPATEEVVVRVDGKPLSREQAAVDRPIDPGAHRVEIQSRDGRRDSRELALAEGAHVDVELALPAPAAPPPPPAVAKAPAPPAGSAKRTAGWVLAVSGAAFTTAGAVSGVLALNDKAALDAVCTPGCPPDQATTIDAFRRERTLSYVGFGLGALGLASGTYLILSSRSAPLGVTLGPQRVALVGAFR
jgi:hypothetical protein